MEFFSFFCAFVVFPRAEGLHRTCDMGILSFHLPKAPNAEVKSISRAPIPVQVVPGAELSWNVAVEVLPHFIM